MCTRLWPSRSRTDEAESGTRLQEGPRPHRPPLGRCGTGGGDTRRDIYHCTHVALNGGYNTSIALGCEFSMVVDFGFRVCDDGCIADHGGSRAGDGSRREDGIDEDWSIFY